MRNLLIDDMRNESHIKDVLSVIARSYEEGLTQLKNGPWDVLYLDHDLASYDALGKEKTGYDLVCFLEENPQYLPKVIICVSSNGPGRLRIQQVIDKLYAKPTSVGDK